MIQLDCVKPGAKPGQVILAVNLSKAGKVEDTLAILEELGYKPTLHNVSLASGVQVFAYLKDEQYPQGVSSKYLMDEWVALQERFAPNCVHLWRGYSTVAECRAS